jgi:hypothetical protein
MAARRGVKVLPFWVISPLSDSLEARDPFGVERRFHEASLITQSPALNLPFFT